MVTQQDIITIDADLMGGKPVFARTRVPVQALFDYLAAGDSLERFLDHFPSVERTHAVAVLEYAQNSMLSMLNLNASATPQALVEVA
jgi:uncharacterized protein (DUF433 family)